MCSQPSNNDNLHNNRDLSRTDFSYYNDYSLSLMSL